MKTLTVGYALGALLTLWWSGAYCTFQAHESRPHAYNPQKRALPQSYVIDANVNAIGEESHVDQPSPKRARGAEWPLKNDVNPVLHRASPMISRDNNAKSDQKKAARPSKFQEGSLNDKPSSLPPHEIIGNDSLMEDYGNNHGAGGASACTYEDPSKTRPPIFRFGRISKSFANYLNPSHVWHGLNGLWKEKDGSHQGGAVNVLEDRKVKAKAAYAELKQTGFEGVQTFHAAQTPSAPMPRTKQPGHNAAEGFRDSAIDVDFDDPHQPECEQGNIRTAVDPTSTSVGTKVPPHFGKSSIRVSSLPVKPLLVNDVQKTMPKPTSEFHLPLPQTETSKTPLSSTMISEMRQLGSNPSRKNLAKQQKLSKRVSDLESKLLFARRELQQSLKTAPSVPELGHSSSRVSAQPSFLPSLPSERLLSPEYETAPVQLRKVSRRISSVPDCKTVTSVRHSTHVSEPLLSPSAQLYNELQQSTRAIKSRDNPVGPSKADHASLMTADQQITNSLSSAAEASVHKRKSFKSRMSSDGMPQTTSKRTMSDSHSHPQAHTQAEAAPKTSKPPVEDTQSLATASRLELYPSSKSPKSTPLLQNQPSTQFLGRSTDSLSSSPVHTRSKSSTTQHKAGTSPPPPSIASPAAKKRRVTFLLDPEEPEKENLPRKAKVLKTDAAAAEVKTVDVIVDKPLPDIQKEEYEWDEDVF